MLSIVCIAGNVYNFRGFREVYRKLGHWRITNGLWTDGNSRFLDRLWNTEPIDWAIGGTTKRNYLVLREILYFYPHFSRVSNILLLKEGLILEKQITYKYKFIFQITWLPNSRNLSVYTAQANVRPHAYPRGPSHVVCQAIGFMSWLTWRILSQWIDTIWLKSMYQEPSNRVHYWLV